MFGVLVRLLLLPACALSADVPNLLFFLADDMGYGDAGYLSTGSAHGSLLTPNMDQMVKDGMSFTEAYAGAPVCAPSRCTLMTGRHSGHCSVRSNGPILAKDDVGVADILRTKANYKTAHIGKWGLGGFDTGADPMEKGFDYYYGQLDQVFCHNYYPPHMDEGEILPGGKMNYTEVQIPKNANASTTQCGTDRLNCLWSGDDWTAKAIAYIKEQTPGQAQPWYLYLSYTAPHAGTIGDGQEDLPPVPRVSTGPYGNRTEELGVEIDYAAAVTEIDRQLGLVLAALDESGQAQDTVVMFASDNGASNEGGHDYSFFNSSGPLHGFKRSLHEGGHRSPLIVQWPGKVAAGVVSNQQWAFYDFMATAAELAGLDPKQDLPDTQRDGYSLVPTLLGKPQEQPEFIYHEYCNPNEFKSGWGQAVRLGNWSGVCVGPKPTAPGLNWPVCTVDTFLLYDLATDPGQTNNVAAANQDAVQSILVVMKNEHVNGNYCGGLL